MLGAFKKPVRFIQFQGHAFASVGQFFFAHDDLATFKYPRYSFMADWRLWREVVAGQMAVQVSTELPRHEPCALAVALAVVGSSRCAGRVAGIALVPPDGALGPGPTRR